MQDVLDEIALESGRHRDKVARNFRMAYVATVTLHDTEGDAIHTIRYGRMPKGDVRGLCRALARDVTAMRAQRPELKIAYLTDGATEFETLYEQHLKTPLGPDAVSLVDFWRAAEYLGAAADPLGAPLGLPVNRHVRLARMSRLAKDEDDHPEAARKHLDDARVLRRAERLDGAAYHSGYVVECALKAVLLHDRSFDAATGTTNPEQLATWHRKAAQQALWS
jgi:hypothetical protein